VKKCPSFHYCLRSRLTICRRGADSIDIIVPGHVEIVLVDVRCVNLIAVKHLYQASAHVSTYCRKDQVSALAPNRVKPAIALAPSRASQPNQVRCGFKTADSLFPSFLPLFLSPVPPLPNVKVRVQTLRIARGRRTSCPPKRQMSRRRTVARFLSRSIWRQTRSMPRPKRPGKPRLSVRLR
jgi:hypothetical protein